MAVLSGLLAIAAGARPTEATAIDFVIVAVSTGLVTWASATAPWWAIAGLAAAGAALALTPVVTIVGLATFAAALRVGMTDHTSHLTNSIIGGLAVNTLIRSEFNDQFGASAIIGLSACAVVLVVGVHDRGVTARRQALRVLAATCVVVLAVTAVSGFLLLRSRHDLSAGQRLAREGYDASLAGDYVAAADLFGQASTAFRDADSSITNPVAYLTRVVPVLAQHHRLATEIVGTGSSSLEDAQAAVQTIAGTDLEIKQGAIDLDALRSTAAPLQQLDTSLATLTASFDRHDSRWFVPAVRRRLDTVRSELAAQSLRLDHLIDAAGHAPTLLGAEGVRTYFVGFTTPAEARGVGGLMGNFAELEVDNGRISLVDFGRATDLNGDQANPPRRVIDGPADFVDRYGGYGFVKPDGGTGSAPWSNITMPGDFRLTADVVAQLYPQSGGRPVDGVILLDAFALDALAGFGGPLPIPSADRVLDPGEVASFLLYSQYELEQEDRVDLLDDVARATLDRLLGGLLPPVPELGTALLPLAQQHRIVAWMVDDDEQAMIERIGLSGRLPDVSGSDGVAVTINNASANKIDAYLDRQVDQRTVIDPSIGRAQSTTTVTLTNTAPSSGLPFVVIGNEIDAPLGTNRTLVSVYTAGPARQVEVDGRAVDFTSGSEAGWSVVSQFITLAAGESATMTVVSETDVDLTIGYRLVAHPQPLVLPAKLTVELVIGKDTEGVASKRVVDEPGFVFPIELSCAIRDHSIDVTSCSR